MQGRATKRQPETVVSGVFIERCFIPNRLLGDVLVWSPRRSRYARVGHLVNGPLTYRKLLCISCNESDAILEIFTALSSQLPTNLNVLHILHISESDHACRGYMHMEGVTSNMDCSSYPHHLI